MTAVMDTDQSKDERSVLLLSRADVQRSISELQKDINEAATKQLLDETKEDFEQIKQLLKRFGYATKDVTVKLLKAGWIIDCSLKLTSGEYSGGNGFTIKANSEICGHMKTLEALKAKQASLDKQILNIQKELQRIAREDG